MMRMTIRCSSFNYHALIAFIQTAFSPGLDSVIAAQHAVTTWLAPRVAAQARTSRTWTASFRIPSSSCQYHLQRAPIDSFAEGWAKVRRAALLNSPPLLLTAHRSTKPQGSRAAGRMVPSPAPRADLRSGFGAPRSTAGAISPRARSPRDGRLCRRRRRFRESLYRAPSALPVTAVPVPGVDEEDAVLACRGSTRTTAARPLHRAATVSYSSVLNRAAGSNESLPPSPLQAIQPESGAQSARPIQICELTRNGEDEPCRLGRPGRLLRRSLIAGKLITGGPVSARHV